MMTRTEIEAVRLRAIESRKALHPLYVTGDHTLTDALGSANIKIAEIERLCDIRLRDLQVKMGDDVS